MKCFDTFSNMEEFKIVINEDVGTLTLFLIVTKSSYVK